MKTYKMGFKDRAANRDFDYNRKKWDDKRDLVVEVQARDAHEARRIGFAMANAQGLGWPFIDDVVEVSG